MPYSTVQWQYIAVAEADADEARGTTRQYNHNNKLSPSAVILCHVIDRKSEHQ
jgi:hypothetical protein